MDDLATLILCAPFFREAALPTDTSQENAAGALWSMYDKADGGSGSSGGGTGGGRPDGPELPATGDPESEQERTFDSDTDREEETAPPADEETVAHENEEGYNEEGKAENGTNSKVKYLKGHAFEDYLTQEYGGSGSFSVAGRDFDGGAGKRWWEAKSGEYWSMLIKNPQQLAKFKSDMGHRLSIAKSNGATYELFSNSPIPEGIKQWLTQKGIPYTELLD